MESKNRDFNTEVDIKQTLQTLENLIAKLNKKAVESANAKETMGINSEIRKVKDVMMLLSEGKNLSSKKCNMVNKKRYTYQNKSHKKELIDSFSCEFCNHRVNEDDSVCPKCNTEFIK